MRTIVTVCTGNLCRSPMAEYILQDELAKAGVDDTVVESAGIAAWEGDRAASMTLSFMAERGYDLSAHRTRRLTKQMIDDADLVLVMDRGHRGAATVLAPQASAKIVLMATLDPSAGDDEIGDPYGMNGQMFARVYETIRNAARALVTDWAKRKDE
jgi:protein-tyrosine phosphatase